MSTKPLKTVIEGLFRKTGTQPTEDISKWLEGPALIAEQVPENIWKPLEEKTFGFVGATNNKEIRDHNLRGTFEYLEARLRDRYKGVFPESTQSADEWLKAKREEKRQDGKPLNAVDIVDEILGQMPDRYAAIQAKAQEANKDAEALKTELEQQYAEKIKNLESALHTKEGELVSLVTTHKTELSQLQEKSLQDRIDWRLGEAVSPLPFLADLKKTEAVFGAVKSGVLSEIKSGYTIKLSDTGELLPYQKDNPELRVVDPETNQPVTIEQLARKAAAPYLDANPPKGGGNGNGGGNGKQLEGGGKPPARKPGAMPSPFARQVTGR